MTLKCSFTWLIFVGLGAVLGALADGGLGAVLGTLPDIGLGAVLGALADIGLYFLTTPRLPFWKFLLRLFG